MPFAIDTALLYNLLQNSQAVIPDGVCGVGNSAPSHAFCALNLFFFGFYLKEIPRFARNDKLNAFL